MKLVYYKGIAPNFGDELNPWLWSRLLPGFFDDDPAELFLGIGSILLDTYPASSRKVVVGSGFAGYSAPPRIDESWEIHFVRGPLTAAALGLDPRLAIGDSAILIRALPVERPANRYKRSFMPHWESAIYGAWESAARAAGLHFIDPRWPVEVVLDHLLATEVLVTEAMHGAIVADALRVPWIAIEPMFTIHRSKWHDWADALGIALQPRVIRPSSPLEAVLRLAERDVRMVDKLRRRGRPYAGHGAMLFRPWAARALEAAARTPPMLSSETRLDAATERMMTIVKSLQAASLRRSVYK